VLLEVVYRVLPSKESRTPIVLDVKDLPVGTGGYASCRSRVMFSTNRLDLVLIVLLCALFL
jgi:hypothetical protein